MSETILDATASAVDAIASLVPEKHHYLGPDAFNVSAFITGDDENLEIDSLERFLPNPRRQRGSVTVWEVAGFLTLLGNSNTTVFADDKNRSLTAILNYNGWRDDRVTLQLKHSPEWTRWAGGNGKLLPQAAFADFLEDGLLAITDPPAADLVEVAQSFQARTKRDFEAGVRQSNGDVTFTYSEETTATAKKGQLAVPEVFKLRLPVFAGGGLVDLEARLRYRVDRDGLSLGYRIARLEDYALAAFQHVMNEVEEGLPLPSFQRIVFGPAADPIADLD